MIAVPPGRRLLCKILPRTMIPWVGVTQFDPGSPIFECNLAWTRTHFQTTRHFYEMYVKLATFDNMDKFPLSMSPSVYIARVEEFGLSTSTQSESVAAVSHGSDRLGYHARKLMFAECVSCQLPCSNKRQ